MAAYKRFSLIWICFIAAYQLLASSTAPAPAPKLAPIYNHFGTITGTVVSGQTGFPLRDAAVSVNRLSVLTDAQGRFALAELRPGKYTIRYSAPAHNPQHQKDVVVRRNTTTSVPTVILSSKGGSVAGRVVSASTGGPMIGVKVTIGSSSATTDSEGKFFFQLVEPGTYRISYQAPGNIQVQDNIFVGERSIATPPDVVMPVFPQVHYGSREKKRIAITIDDGFRRDYELVSLLKSHGIRATAFMVGQAAQRHPEFVRTLDSLGWEVANHTYSHTNPLKQSDAQIINELQSAQRIITGITHKQSSFARSPQGNGDPRVLSAINAAGYTAAFWSLDLLDTRKDIPLEVQVGEVLGRVRNGDILVCHFGGNNTARALSIIIPELQKRGYEFVTLSELFE